MRRDFYFSRIYNLMAVIFFSTLVLAHSVYAQSHDMRESLKCDRAHVLPNADQLYLYSSTDQPVEEALRLFGRNVGLAVNLVGDISGNIRLKNDDRFTQENYLNRIAEEFALVWYFDGITLHISTNNDIKTQLISMQENNGEGALRALQALGLYQCKFIHKADDQRQIVRVSGPSSYIETIVEALKALEEASDSPLIILRGGTSGRNVGGIDKPDVDKK